MYGRFASAMDERVEASPEVGTTGDEVVADGDGLPTLKPPGVFPENQTETSDKLCFFSDRTIYKLSLYHGITTISL